MLNQSAAKDDSVRLLSENEQKLPTLIVGGVTVITKKCSDHEIFITEINIHVIFSNFTKILSYTVMFFKDTIHTYMWFN